MKKIKSIIITILLLIIFIPNLKASDTVNAYLFYGKECHNCENEMKFWNEYLKTNNKVILYKYEVWHNEENYNKLINVMDILKYDNNGKVAVPFLVIGNEYIVGYGGNYTKENIKDKINYYLNNEYNDEVGQYLQIENAKNNPNVEVIDHSKDESFYIPLLGKINAKTVSLPVLSVILGFFDGLNPCAMWVLIFLITMLINFKSRSKMWTIGLTFIITSALVYLLFMLSYLTIAVSLNEKILYRIIIGLFAIIFGIVNITKFIKTKNDGCKVVDAKKKSKIMQGIKDIVKSKSFIISILGTILLAFIVNLIELGCSLGLPVIFTQVLSINNLSSFERMLYLIMYIFFFMIDDLIIFFIAMKTFKITAISNKYAKISSLVGGLVMVLIGILMIFKMEWLTFSF